MVLFFNFTFFVFLFYLTLLTFSKTFLQGGYFCRTDGVGLGGGGGGGVGWVGVVFYFVDTVLFCRTVFVGRWVAMVLTSSSCNLGIEIIISIADKYQTSWNFTFWLKNLVAILFYFIYLIYLRFQKLWSRFWF